MSTERLEAERATAGRAGMESSDAMECSEDHESAGAIGGGEVVRCNGWMGGWMKKRVFWTIGILNNQTTESPP